MDKKLYGGIDIGGTKIRMGLVNGTGKVLFRKMFLTPLHKGWKNIMDMVVKYFYDMLQEAQVDIHDLYGIGTGCPGTFDTKREVISFAPNLNWRNIPIKSYLKARFPITILLENDTNLSTIGIAAYGEGRKIETLIGIFIGTGIGGGIILNRELFIGSTGGAGEIGHMIVKENGPKCNCGNRGCLEAIASTRAIYEKIYNNYSRKYKGTDTFWNFKNNANKSLAIKLAYGSHEPHAVKIVNDAFFSLGMGLVSLLNLLNPEMIIFGGGLSETLGDVLINQVQPVVAQRAMPGTFEKVVITRTSLGEDAPIFGAAALVETVRKK